MLMSTEHIVTPNLAQPFPISINSHGSPERRYYVLRFTDKPKCRDVITATDVAA